MGKARAIVSLLVNGFFFFVLPSLLFYYFALLSEMGVDSTVGFEALNFYLPKMVIDLFDLPVGPIALPVGFRFTLTSILGLVITLISFVGSLSEGLFTIGTTKLKKRKFFGFIKYVFGFIWVWFFYQQLSKFLITIEAVEFTLIIHWTFYLAAGLLVMLFTALANFLGAFVSEKPELSVKEPNKEHKSNKKTKKE